MTSATEHLFQGRPLPPEWADYLRDRAVTPAVAAARGYQAVRAGKDVDHEYAAAWGYSRKSYGLLIPLHGILDAPSTDEGSSTHQLRLDPAYLEANPKAPRFRTPVGQPNVLATSPVTRNRLKEAREGITIAEGVTRVDALAGFNLPAVGIQGINNWKGGKPPVVLADFDALGIKGNRFLIAVDGDASTNTKVDRGLKGLIRLLKAKGAARVLVLDVPDGLGLDDWFARSNFPDKNAAMAALKQHSVPRIEYRPKAPVVGDTIDVTDAGPWSCTPAGDVLRLLQYAPTKICVVRGMVGGEWGLLVQQQGGRWSSATDMSAIGHLHMSTALEWQRRVSKAVMEGALADGQAAACTRHAVTSCKALGIRELVAVLGTAFTYMEANHLVPDGVTVCDAADLDRNPERRYLGAKNGVIDLNTALLLPPAEARQKFVTRHLPDDYLSDAKHPFADQLLSHLEDSDRDYLLGALGFALRGNVARRVYGLAGDWGGAKSTLFTAILAALGLARANGYGLRLDPESLVKSSWGRGGNAHHGNLMGLQDARIAVCEEPPDGRSLDAQLLNDLSGGAPAAFRNVGEKMGPERPVTSTIFLGFNPGQEDVLDTSNNALADRARLLRYPRLKVVPIPGRIIDVAELVEVRQAWVAMLVSAAKRHQTRPSEPPTVKDYTRERYEDSIGPVGRYIARYMRVTGKRDDVLDVDELIASIEGACGEKDKDGLVDGLDRKAILQRVREVLASKDQKLPRQKRGGGGKQVYLGVLLMDDADLDAEAMADELEGKVYCPECPALMDEGRELCPDCEEKSRGGPASGGSAVGTSTASPLTEEVNTRLELLESQPSMHTREDWSLYGALRGIAGALADNPALMPPQVVAHYGGPAQVVDRIAGVVASPAFIKKSEGAYTNGEFAAVVEKADWTGYFQTLREGHARASDNIVEQLREFLIGIWQPALPWAKDDRLHRSKAE